MSANPAVIDTRANTVPPRWEEPVRSPMPAPVPQSDPRLELSQDALVLANTNAFPIVARNNARRDSLGIAAGGALALVLGCATFMSLHSHSHAPAAPRATVPLATQTRPLLSLATPVPGAPIIPPAIVAPQSPPSVAPGVVRAPASMTMPGMAPTSAPVLVYDGSSAQVATVGGNPEMAAAPEGAPAMLGGGVAAGGPASDNNAVHATKLADPGTTVVQGTLIPAVLETAIDTDVPGYARAVVSQDVRSFDGSRVLIPRSSRLIGEYKGVTQAGQRRAYLVWTRLVRPDGVSIALASPAADFSGQAGVGGHVNSHFLSRFGSSILLSILGGAGSLITGGASTVVVSGGQSAASVAAEHDGNRPPTIKVQQGQPIRVFTARDLIFSDGAKG